MINDLKYRKEYLITCLVFCLTLTALEAQSIKKNILGDWIKFKAERVDGSRIIDRLGMDTAYLEYSFSAKEFSFQRDPVQKKEGLDYDIRGDKIQVGFFSEYRIENLTKDTLILAEVSQKVPDYELNRYYFVKKDILSSKYPIRFENNTPVYNLYKTPRLHKYFRKYLKDCNQDKSAFFKFKGYLVFDRKNKRITAKLEPLNKMNQALASTLKTCIENSFLYWDFSEITYYRESKIYFVAKSFPKTGAIRFLFTAEDASELKQIKSIDFDKINTSKKLYLAGLADLENQRLDSAIDNFTQSYELDEIRITALYKRAEAYIEKGELSKACKDWELLKTMNQKQGQKKFEKHCN